MSLYKEREDYLKAMCTAHPTVAHGAARPGGNGLRKSFFRINNEEEITSDLFTGMDFPCVAQIDFDGRMLDNGNALVDIRHVIQNNWWFITKVNTAGDNEGSGRVDRISDAYDLTFAIMEDFIRSMKDEYEANGSCGIFQQFDLNRMQYRQIGPVVEYEYGWILSFEDQQSADRITGNTGIDMGDVIVTNGTLNPEIIFFTNVPDLYVLWTSLRKQKYGVMPLVQVWLIDDTGKHYLSTIQPYFDVPPPNFTRMDFDFGGNTSGFVLIK